MVEDGSDGHGETPQGGGLLPEPAAPFAPEAAVLFLVDVAAGCRSHAAGEIAVAEGGVGVGALAGFEDLDVVGVPKPPGPMNEISPLIRAARSSRVSSAKPAPIR